VVGAGNSAGQAVHLAKYAQRVTILVRGGALGTTMSDYLVKTIEATDNIDARLDTTIVEGHGAGQLEELVLRKQHHRSDPDRPGGGLVHPRRCPTAHRLAARGHPARPPRLHPHRQRPRTHRRHPRRGGAATTTLSTRDQHAGVFAAGDVRHGSVKRVASAVGEGGISIRSVHQHLAQLRENDEKR
jgi:thioredoxin reductase (NADPH)